MALVSVIALAAVAMAAARLADGGERGGASGPDLHTVSAGSFEIIVSASGELEAAKQTEIRSELESPADIVEIVDEGARVEQGDVLVRLNDESIRTKIEDQLLSVEAARSDLVGAENALAIQMNENDAALRQALLKVELAEIDLEKWVEGEVPKKRLELRTNLEKAERDKERLEEKLERSRDLYAKSFLSKDELQQDEIRYLEAAAALERARKDQEVYETYEHERDRKKKESDVEEARAELERVKRLNESRLASKEADVTNKRRQLAIREDRLAKLQEQLEAATMRAPTAGLVVYGTSIGNSRGFVMINGDGPMQIGRTVRPNELIIVLPDTSRMLASVRVHESVAGRIRPGQRATVRVDAIRDRVFSGQVQSVSVLAESGGWRDPNLREYTVKIALDGGNPGQALKPSMRADAEIVLGEVAGALAAPIQAVFHEGDVAFVYAERGGKFEKRPVRTGRQSATMVEIVKGLDEGAVVLLREPSPGEILNQEISPAAIAAIQPTPEEIKAAEEARRAEQEALAAASEPEIDVEAIRNNPNLPEQVKERLKKMTDDEIRKMAKRFSSGRPGQGGQGGAGRVQRPASDN
ncbi:MAG: HlyD family efflux transporter periplasmic adaptor subunit [Planctomycetota bacterium]|nr:MAG: HlyD family efflux transporter periplasmic adaptor subunit [Planctomycetota bacterium]